MAHTKTHVQPAFSGTFLAQIKQILSDELSKLQKEIETFAVKNPKAKEDDFDAEFPKYGDSEDDNVHEIEEYSVNKPLEMTLEKNLRDIKKALKRIADGSYGVCKYCQKSIDEKRLMARPTSSACVSCKKTLTDEV